jgi:hypothetical protein
MPAKHRQTDPGASRRRILLALGAVVVIAAVAVVAVLVLSKKSPGTVQGTFRMVAGPVNTPVTGTVQARLIAPGQSLATVRQSTSTPAATTQTDATGHFSLSVAPGTYELSGQTLQPGLGPTYPCYSVTVTVTSGATQAADVICDTK